MSFRWKSMTQNMSLIHIFSISGSLQKLMGKIETMGSQQKEILVHLHQLRAEKEVSGAALVEDVLERAATSKAEVDELYRRLEDILNVNDLSAWGDVPTGHTGT